MTQQERKLLEDLKCYVFIQKDIERLKERLGRMVYGTTPSYNLAGGGSGGLPGSKVEALVIRRNETEQEIERKRKRIMEINYAVRNAGLDQTERDVILLTIKGLPLTDYADEKNISYSNVYRTREKALKKMAKCSSQNTK